MVGRLRREEVMRASTKFKLLWAIAAILAVAAIVLAAFGIYLIRAGAYPFEGTGSLGHVGMVIAGIIALFIGVVLSLFSAFCISKARVAARADNLASGNDPSKS